MNRSGVKRHRAGSVRLGTTPWPLALNGLRISEALGADIEDIEFERGYAP